MANRGPAILLALAAVAALLPSAGAQDLPQLPVTIPLDDVAVIAVAVPIAGAAGQASIQVPIDGGILDLVLVPVALPGPGGSIDVGAYLVQARALLPDGTSLPLPSMVIQTQGQAAEGPSAAALDDLVAQTDQLRAAADQLAASIPAAPSDDGSSEPSPPSDPMADEIAGLQAQAEALAAEAAWIHAFAEAAAGAVGDGIAEQAAIADGALSRVDAGLVLLQDGLGRLQAASDQAAGRLPGPHPSAPPAAASSSASPSAPSAPSPSVPAPPDLAPVLAAIEQMQAKADAAQAGAQSARDDLAAKAGGLLDAARSVADERLVQAQAAVDGARAAASAAQEDLDARAAQREEAANARLADLQAALGDHASSGQQKADAAAERASDALAKASGDLQWASDWIAEAQEFGSTGMQGSLDDASHSIDSAQHTVQAMADLMRSYAPAEGQSALDAFTMQLDQAQRDAQSASDQAGAAQQQLDQALAMLGSVPGGLDPASLVSAPQVPEAPGAPASFDPDAFEVCSDSPGLRGCFAYRSPLAGEPGSLTVLVAVPTGLGSIVGQIGSLPGALGGLPVPAPSGIPQPDPSILPLPLPSLPGLPGLPGSSSSTSSSAAGSTSSASSAASPTSSSTSSGSGGASDPAPSLSMSAAPSRLALDSGEEGSVVVTVRNDGTAADIVRLTGQSDAPVAFDTTDEAVSIPAGGSHDFPVRILPTGSGSGSLAFLATGDKSGTVGDAVAIDIAPAAPVAAAIAAALDPTQIRGPAGRTMPVTLHLQNKGPASDVVHVVASGDGLAVDQGRFDVALAPGESAVREILVTPQETSTSQMVVAITSDHGADLKPAVHFDLLPSQARAPQTIGDSGSDPTGSGSHGNGAPGLGLVATGITLALVAFAIRRRLA